MKELARKFWVFGIAALAAIVFALAGCDQLADAISDGNQNNEEEEEEPGFVAVTNITLLENSRVAGTEIDLNALAVVTPENATVQGPVKWYVIDAGTTGVSTGPVEDGIITPATAGTFTLSATIDNAIADGAEDYEKITGLAITVTAGFVAVEDISWTPPTGKKANMEIDLSNATVAPPDATNKTITWTASGAGLTGTGNWTSVTPTEAGTLTLTATIVNGAAEDEDYTEEEPFTVTVGVNTGIDLTGVTLSSVVPDGSGDTFAATTKVTLTFSEDVAGLEAGHIAFAADGATVAAGTLVKATGTGVYELPVDALLEEGPNAGKAFTVTVSDGDNPLTDTVTLYAWIAVADDNTLEAIGTDATTLGGWYKQTENITISNSWTPIGGTSSTPFTGVYDGNNKVITPSSVTITSSSSLCVGIFGYAANAEFKNIRIGGGSIIATGTTGHMGSIVGRVDPASFTNCLNDANLTLTTGNVGGICGYIRYGSTITGCGNTGTITAVSAGGIFTSSNGNESGSSSVIQNCYNDGNINGTTRIGGIASSATSVKIIACYNTGDLAVSNATGTSVQVAGIAGLLTGNVATGIGFITACYNTGTLSSNVTRVNNLTLCFGGISGRNDNGYVAITACYNSGSISYTGSGSEGNLFVGGISGYCNESGTVETSKKAVITNCYWKKEGNPDNGIGGKRDAEHTTVAAATSNPSNEGTTGFNGEAQGWPSSSDTGWGIGNNSASGQYWKSLGSWKNGSPEYPRLWFGN